MSRHREIAGHRICDTDQRIFSRFLNRRLKMRSRTIVFFVNANFVVRCAHLSPEISAALDIFLLNDGVAMDAAAWVSSGSFFRQNMNGTDFVPSFLAHLKCPTRLFLLGASGSSVRVAASVFGALPNVTVVGYADGYSALEQPPSVLLSEINATRADLLLVALGNPLQEEWILRYRSGLDAPLIIGVGALFDFISETKPRASAFLRKMRLEWAFRLAHEPRRLWKRYTLGTARFVFEVLRHRSANRPGVKVSEPVRFVEIDSGQNAS